MSTATASAKKPQNSYIFYSIEARKTMSDEARKTMSDEEKKNFVVNVANNWQKMTKDQKAPYEEMARLDQGRYTAEKAIAVEKAKVKAKADMEELIKTKDESVYLIFSDYPDSDGPSILHYIGTNLNAMNLDVIDCEEDVYEHYICKFPLKNGGVNMYQLLVGYHAEPALIEKNNIFHGSYEELKEFISEYTKE